MELRVLCCGSGIFFLYLDHFQNLIFTGKLMEIFKKIEIIVNHNIALGGDKL